jgi:hypothetical protein
MRAALHVKGLEEDQDAEMVIKLKDAGRLLLLECRKEKKRKEKHSEADDQYCGTRLHQWPMANASVVTVRGPKESSSSIIQPCGD